MQILSFRSAASRMRVTAGRMSGIRKGSLRSLSLGCKKLSIAAPSGTPLWRTRWRRISGKSSSAACPFGKKGSPRITHRKAVARIKTRTLHPITTSDKGGCGLWRSSTICPDGHARQVKGIRAAGIAGLSPVCPWISERNKPRRYISFSDHGFASCKLAFPAIP